MKTMKENKPIKGHSKPPPRGMLGNMIKTGVIASGNKAIYVQYKDKTVYVDLLPDGTLRVSGEYEVYKGISAITLMIKQRFNPALKCDAGWISCISVEHGDNLRQIRENYLSMLGSEGKASIEGISEDSIEDEYYSASQPMESTVKLQKPLRTRSSSDAQELKVLRNLKPEAAAAAQRTEPEVPIRQKASKYACNICFLDNERGRMLVCAACKGSFHSYCVSNTRAESSPGHWFCQDCFEKQVQIILPFLSALQRQVQPSELKGRVDDLLNSLTTNEQKMDILASSTGEVLVHLSKMDLPRELEEIEEFLQKQEREPPVLNLASQLVNIIDAHHRVSTGLSQISQTVESLTNRSNAALNDCVEQIQKCTSDLADEAKQRSDTLESVETLKIKVPQIKKKLERQNAALKSLRSSQELARNMVLHEKLLPAYKTFVKDVRGCGTTMLESAIETKIMQLTSSLEEWNKTELYYEEMMQKIGREMHQGYKRKADDMEVESSSISVPPTKRLMLRQLGFYENSVKANRVKSQNARIHLLELKKAVESKKSNFKMLDMINYALQLPECVSELELNDALI